MTAGITTPRPETPLAAADRPTPRMSRRTRIPRSPKVIAGLAILALFAVIAVIGPLIAPYSPNETGIYCRAACSGAKAAAAWLQTIVVHPAEQVCNAAGTVCFSSPAVLAFLPKPPSGTHWLGTTVFAQDVWSQLLVSTRATLLVGFVAGAIATALSVIVGVSAGYLGGNADEGLSLLSNVFLAIPGLPLLIVLASYVPSAGANVVLIALIVAATGWAYGARVLRAQTLSLRNRDFVEAARVSGEGRMRIIVVEVLPNLLPIVASSFLFTTLYAVGAYVALAFLGLAGAPNATPAGLWNWGEMLQQAYPQDAVASGWWWWWLPPGFCIALLGMGLARLNFVIDEFVNPRLRAAGLSRRSARRAGIRFRPRLGITPVMHRQGTAGRQLAATAAAMSATGPAAPTAAGSHRTSP